VRVWTRFTWLRIGLLVNPCECDNELSGFIMGREFLDKLTNYYIHRKD
jgi:hypothetical protein